MAAHQLIAPDVKLGRNVRIHAFVNLYGCEIGDETKIGTFVEIQKGAKIGERCKISSHTFICEGVTIEAEVFVGHGVTFINDRYPRVDQSKRTSCKPKPTGVARRPSSGGAHPLVRAPLSWVESALAKMPLWAPVASSPKTCRQLLRSPEILPKF